MKKILLGLFLIITASVLCSAQSALWAGNAARGNDDAFPASVRSSGKAAGMSLALPEGTLVQVKNQKNGQTVDVTIVAGLGKPGIFLLLNSTAADALSIHTGEVIMVEIQEKSSVSNPFLDYSADPDSFKKNLNDDILAKAGDDPDNTAAVDVEGEMSRMGYEAAAETEPVATEETAESPTVVEPLPVEESSEPEESITVPETDDDRDFDDIVIAESEETYDAVLDYGDGAEEAVPEPEAVPEEETVAEETPFLSEDLTLTVPEPEKEGPAEETALAMAEPEPEEPAAEEEAGGTGAEASVPIDPDRVIYFLTPAELRPPEPAEDEAPPLPVWEKEEDVLTVATAEEEPGKEESGVPAEETAGNAFAEATSDEPEIHFVPQYIDPDDLETYMRDTLEDGSRYVQVASFGREDSRRVYDRMVELQKSFPYLPIILLPGTGRDTFKLMVGPVSRDEVGILLYTMKSRGFPDAFLNRK